MPSLNVGMTDPITQMAAQAPQPATAPAPTQPLGDGGVGAMQGLTADYQRQLKPIQQQESQALTGIADATKQSAQAGMDADTNAQAAIQQQQGQFEQAPDFKPSPENKDKWTALFAATAAMTFLGGGRTSGNMALSSMAGAMKGYAQGRDDLAKTEMANYQASIEKINQHNSVLKDKISNIVHLWTIDKDKAQQEMTKLSADPEAKLAAAQAQRGDLNGLIKLKGDIIKAEQAHQDKMLVLGMRFGSMGGGGGLSPAAMQQQVDLYHVLGNKAFPSRMPFGERQEIINAHAIKYPQGGIEEGIADYGALQQADKKATTYIAMAEPALKKLEDHIEIARDMLRKGFQTTDLRNVNQPINYLRKIIGDKEFGQLQLQLQLAATEFERLQQGPMSNAMLHEGARQAGQALLDSNATADYLDGQFDLITKDGQLNIYENKEGKKNLQAQIRGLTNPNQAPASMAKPSLTAPGTHNSAPQAALDRLKANPSLKNDFQEMYGYLPEGY